MVAMSYDVMGSCCGNDGDNKQYVWENEQTFVDGRPKIEKESNKKKQRNNRR